MNSVLLDMLSTYAIHTQLLSIAAGAKEEQNSRYLDISTVFDGEYLRGKRVVVTGGGRGLGLEIVKRAKECGAKVIITCRQSSDEVQGLAEVYADVDVTDFDALKDFSAKVVEEHGVIDILINNAGYFYGPQEKVIEDTLNFEEQMKQIDICALGPLRVTSALFKAGAFKEGSKAVIITSQAGSVEWRLTQNPEGGDYGHHMSRAACNIMGVLLSQELKSKGIAILLLHPGFNKTEMTKKYEHIWEVEGAVEPWQGAMRVLYEIGARGIDDTGKFINCEDGLEIPWPNLGQDVTVYYLVGDKPYDVARTRNAQSHSYDVCRTKRLVNNEGVVFSNVVEWSFDQAVQSYPTMLWLFFYGSVMSRAAADIAEQCKVMHSGINFTQEEAPQDISAAEPMILHKVNEIIDNLLSVAHSVSILYSGSDVRGREIGSRKVKALIERKVDGLKIDECYLVMYTVRDTDECTTKNSAWKHRCHSSAECVNTIGSYECQCMDGTFGSLTSGAVSTAAKSRFGLGVRNSAPGSCWGHPNTTACCKHGLEERCDVDACVKTCKSEFACISDPCTGDIKAKFCPVETTCVPGEGGRPEMWAPTDEFRADLRGNFECLYDVCANHDCPCNCHCVPQSEKGYTCEPDEGYRKFPLDEPGVHRNKSSLRLDNGTCISKQPPRMKLRGSRTYKLQQGDDYKEQGAEIDDPGITKSLTRRIRVTYPNGHLGRCVSDIGTFTVNYRLDDWIADETLALGENESLPTWDSQNRTVIVSDVDECSYRGPCEQFVAKCVPAANCVNTVGSYGCKCRGGYHGDGRTDGEGCIDVRPPVIKCDGAGCYPKEFRAADIRGLVSADRQYYNVSNTSDLTFVKTKIQEIFEQGKKEKSDPFCETSVYSRPCFKAYDIAYSPIDGTELVVELTPNIMMTTLDVPTQAELESGAFHANNTALRFAVTYTVSDESGNIAFAQREVKVTAFSNDLLAQLTRDRVGFAVKKVVVLGGLLFAIIALIVWLWSFRNSLLGFVQIAPFTLAYLLLPQKVFGRLADRRQFVAAVDAWLCVSRLGMLDEHERLTRAFQEFGDAQNGDD